MNKGHFKAYMQKNLTQLLAMYGDSRIPYPSFRAFTTLLEKHHYDQIPRLLLVDLF